jgi:dipeptidyl aminopeptidase/acylaminoacyl peptidase
MPHGGPYLASINNFGGAVVPNLFCAAGYACLLPNFRGSTGYGRLFTRKIVRDWGDGPFGDIHVGVDSLVGRRLVDGRRLAIFGGSYGGYMTCWTIAHTSRYRCAVAVAAVTNNLTEWASNDIPSFCLYSAGGALPSFSDGFWRDQSPVHHVARVKTPTLIITSEADVRVPPGQSWDFYRALRLRGVPTQLLLYPREGHGVAEPRHHLHYFRQVLDYVNQHVKR